MGLDTVQRSYSQGYGAEVLFSHAQAETSPQTFNDDLQSTLQGLAGEFNKSKVSLHRSRAKACKPKQDFKSCCPLGQDIMQVISWSTCPEDTDKIPAYQSLADLKIAVSCKLEDDLGYDCDATELMNYSASLSLASRASSGAESIAPKIGFLEPTTPSTLVQRLADPNFPWPEQYSQPLDSSLLLPWDTN